MRISKGFAGVVALLCGLSALHAQVAGRVTGSVVDATGAGVPGAAIGLQLPGSKTNVYTALSGSDGAFAIQTVNAGTYDLAIEAKGFLKKVLADVRVSPNRATDLAPIKMEISAVTETVEVTSAREGVETSNAEVSSTITKSQIQNLPIMNRGPLGFLQTQAGINNARGNTTVNGQRSTYVNVTLDGVNVQDNFIRTNDVDFLPNLLELDQVAEVTVVTSNASAANPGGSAQVQFVTPSGTNQYHGNAYWSNRNNYFAANTWFNNQAGVAKPFLNQNQLGGSLGGPILKNKLLFYTNYEAFRLKQQTAQNHTVLTPDARNGIFTYLVSGNPQKVNVLQTAGVTADSSITSLLQNVPTTINNYNVGDSTSSLLRNTAGYTFNKRNNRDRNNFTAKGDYLFSPRNSFTVTYAYNTDVLDRPDLDSTYAVVPSVTNDDPTKLLSAAWRSSPTPTLTNEVRFGFNWAPATFAAGQAIPNYFLTGMNFTNPVNTFRTQGRNTDTYNYADNANWVHGKHSLGFGFQAQAVRIEQYNDAGITPSYGLGIGSGNTGLITSQLPGISSTDLSAANSLLATLTGYLTSYTQNFNVKTTTSGFVNGYGNIRHNTLDNYALYVQDSWRLNRKLTITMGARWDYYTPVDERDSLALFPVIQGNVIQTLLNPNTMLDFAGKSVGRPWYQSDKNNIAPNLGIAWDPTGEGKWAIRAGYSLAFVNDNLVRAADNSQATNAGLQSTVSKTGLSGLLRAGVPAVPTPTYKVPRSLADNYALSTGSALAVPNPGLVTPYVQQYSFGIQRSIKGYVVEARYVGNHSTKSMRGFDYNQVVINGILPDFKVAMNNGLASQRAGGAFLPAYNPNIPGSQPLPYFSQLASGGLLTNSTIISTIQTGQVGELGNLYQTNLLNGSVNFFNNPNILGANALTNYSNSRYNGLQVEVNHYFAQGFQLQANYVFSKVMGDAGGEQQTNFEPFLDIKNAKIEKSRISGSDLTHVFKLNSSWDLPVGKNQRFDVSNRVLNRIVGGWNLAGIMTLQSGTPFSVLSGRGTLNRAGRSTGETANTTLNKSQLDQMFGFQMTGAGPMFVPASVKGTDGRAVAPDGSAFFTGQVFYHPGPGEIGGLQKNYFSGPSVFNLDAKISKTIPIKEAKSLELRMDASNVFNNPTWFVGDQSISSTNFGKITSNFYSRRLVQFAVAFKF